MFLDQHTDQTKQLLMLRFLSRVQEGSNLDLGDMASGGNVGRMSDEHLTRDSADQVPAIAVGTAIKAYEPSSCIMLRFSPEMAGQQRASMRMIPSIMRIVSNRENPGLQRLVRDFCDDARCSVIPHASSRY